jgi:hypothetical protein
MALPATTAFCLAFLWLLLPALGQSQSPRDPFEAALRTIISELQSNVSVMFAGMTHTKQIYAQLKTQPTLSEQVLMQGLFNFRS